MPSKLAVLLKDLKGELTKLKKWTKPLSKRTAAMAHNKVAETMNELLRQRQAANNAEEFDAEFKRTFWSLLNDISRRATNTGVPESLENVHGWELRAVPPKKAKTATANGTGEWYRRMVPQATAATNGTS